MSDCQPNKDIGSAPHKGKAMADGGRVGFVVAADARPREFLGVPFDLLAVGEKLMITRMRYRTGMTVPKHSHENEQAGYVVSGRYRQTADGTTYELHSGDSYAIPGGIDHSMDVLEGGEVIDIFTPPREDYR